MKPQRRIQRQPLAKATRAMRACGVPAQPGRGLNLLIEGGSVTAYGQSVCGSLPGQARSRPLGILEKPVRFRPVSIQFARQRGGVRPIGTTPGTLLPVPVLAGSVVVAEPQQNEARESTRTVHRGSHHRGLSRRAFNLRAVK